MYHYGIRGIINDSFHSYLTECVQSTLIGSKVFTKLLTACGVPQGSVLGPLLFLLYVNDLCRSSDKLSFYLFADDTNLLYADRDINSLKRVVNAELSEVQEWLIANRLILNAKKSNFVIFHPYQKKLDRDVILRIFDIETHDFVLLDQKTYIKYLGILIDSNLRWKYHISYITSKISKTTGVIARLRHFVPTSMLLTLYRSLLSPYLLYGVTVWGQAPQIYLNQILVLQKRALRLIYFAPYRSSAVSLFVSSGCLPIGLLYFKAVSILIHDVLNNLSPRNISNLFSSVNVIHAYSTRFSSASNLYTKYSRLTHQIKSFSRRGVMIWNSIPQDQFPQGNYLGHTSRIKCDTIYFKFSSRRRIMLPYQLLCQIYKKITKII